MGKTAEELRWEIDQRRSELTRDFDAIGDRVSPGRVVERKTEAVKSRFRDAKESVMGSAEDLNGGAHDRAAELRDHAGEVRASAADAVHSTQGTIQDGVHTAGERVAEVPGFVRHETRGNPLAAGLVAFGLGLLAATVLPETRKERQLARKVQPRLEDAARAAGDSGRTLADELKPAVQDAATHLQDSARESAQHVTDHAKDAAQTVSQDARGAAGDVKDAART